MSYRESGATWRPLWITLAFLAAAVLLDVVLPGPDHIAAWLVVIPLVAGVFEAGAQVLGGGWSVPKGRAALPLRRTDGASLLVPTRDPDSLRRALLARLGTSAGSEVQQ